MPEPISSDAIPDAATIVGLLADSDRRAVVASLVLGATTVDAVTSATRLDQAAVGKALARLVSAGLVLSKGGGLHLLSEAFAAASRAAHEAAPRPTLGDDSLPPDMAKVLRAFVVDGRLTQIPANHSKRLVVLDWLAQEFEPGVHYSEPMVNLMLGRRHADTAALRRYLVDEGFLDRASGEYWRSGGSALPPSSP